VTDCTSHEEMVQRALEAWLSRWRHLWAPQCRGGEGCCGQGKSGEVRGTRKAYFWAPSTGLAACLRTPSAPLAVEFIFSCARPPAALEGAELRGPFALEPLTDGAAAALDMGVSS